MPDCMIDYAALSVQLDTLLPQLRTGHIKAIVYGVSDDKPWYAHHALCMHSAHGHTEFQLQRMVQGGHVLPMRAFHIGTADSDLKAELHRMAQAAHRTNPHANARGYLRRNTFRRDRLPTFCYYPG